MAKRTNDQTPQRPNASLRVRWVEVELNGSDTSIEEALRAVERMRRPTIDTPRAPKRITGPVPPAETEDVPAEDPTLFDNMDNAQSDSVTTEPESDSDAESNAATNGARKKRGGGEPKDRNAGIKPVGDIDFISSGKKSLKDLFAEKTPNSDMDQILVICYFLEHIAESPKIGPGHILSGFKHVSKPVPKDLKQTIRNMKEKKAWINFTDIESIRLTTEGDNRIEHKLGKEASDVGAN